MTREQEASNPARDEGYRFLFRDQAGRVVYERLGPYGISSDLDIISDAGFAAYELSEMEGKSISGLSIDIKHPTGRIIHHIHNAESALKFV
jgi:hypothetical protein